VAAVHALTNATVAADRVFDSAIQAIDETMSTERQPVIVVYTEDTVAEPAGRDPLGGDKNMDLILELAVAAKVLVEPPKAGDSLASPPVTPVAGITVPHTDAGLEVVINILGRQVLRGLFAGETEWSRIFMGLVASIKNITTRRGADDKNGIRFAARQYVFNLVTLDDPPFGETASFNLKIKAALDKMAADPDLGDLAAAVTDEIGGGPLLDWDRLRAAVGMTPDEFGGIGLAPFIDPATHADDVVPFSVITFDGRDVSTALADANLPGEEL
jgi:hypothetical protein